MASKQLVADILSGSSPELSREFRDLPLANKILELEKAVIEPKKSDTPAMLNALIKELVAQGAIYPDEASAVYGRLLSRVVKFNSIRNHNSLAGLVEDIQQGQKSSIMAKLKNIPAMSNMVVLQHFFSSLPKTVSSGQQNYDAFKHLLKQFVIDYNQYVEVFKSGTDTFLQYNFGPQVQKVNLSQAFENLRKLWGVKITSEDSIPSLTSLLQPQTRLLMLLLSPISIDGYFIRDSFLGYTMKLYKNTVAPPLNSQPVEELGHLISSLGPSYDQLKLRQGLNYLVTNQQTQYRPEVPDLTREEEALIKYIQTLLKTKIVGSNRLLTERDLDNVIQNINPVAFSGHIDFVNKLVDYFRKILQIKPQLLNRIVMSPNWKPPPSFFLQNVLLPQDLEMPPPPPPSTTGQTSHNVPLVPPTPLPRKIRPPQRPMPSIPSTSYRSPVSGFETDTETDSDFEVPPYRGPRRERVKIDFDNLTTSFKKLRGKGLSNIVVSDLRRKARQVNIRPY